MARSAPVASARLAAIAAFALVPNGAAAEPLPAEARAAGAIVVAVGAEASGASRSLARATYGDDALRPRIDEATARVLAGEAAPAGAPARLVEIEALRKSVTPPATGAPERRLLAALGADARAEIVVAVSRAGEGAVARVLRVSTSQWEGVELEATSLRDEAGDEAGEARWSWPTKSVAALRALLTPAAAAPRAGSTPGPRATPSPAMAAGPTAGSEPAPASGGEPASGKRPFWSSSSFWLPVGIGVAAAVGLGVLIASQAGAQDPGTVQLRGRVAP